MSLAKNLLCLPQNIIYILNIRYPTLHSIVATSVWTSTFHQLPFCPLVKLQYCKKNQQFLLEELFMHGLIMYQLVSGFGAVAMDME